MLDPVLEPGASEGLVDAMERDVAVLELEIAARTEGAESGFDNAKVGFETNGKSAAVDVVKLMGEIPGLFSIFDLEEAILWVTGFLLQCL